MHRWDFEQVKIGEKLYVKGRSRYRGQCGVVIDKTDHWAKLVFGIAQQEKIYSYYVLQREPLLVETETEGYGGRNITLYKCDKKKLTPPENFIPYNCSDGYKDEVWVDTCIADEIETLWLYGIKTTGCCCGHGATLGFIQVRPEYIGDMEKLGYVHYIYDNLFGCVERKDAFIPKSYGHIYDGYSEGYLG